MIETHTNGSLSRLREENIRLRNRLAETEETLRAIGNGDVDAVVVNGRGGQKVYSLQDAENLYRRLAETIREPTLALNEDNTIVFFNDRFQEIVGLASEQIVGLKMYDLIHGDDRDAFRNLLRGARESRTPEGRARVLSRQGLAVPVYWRVNCLERNDGKMTCLVGTDLSQLEASAVAVEQLKQQQDELIATHNELERSRGRYADLYDSAPVGYLTLGRNGCIRGINVTGAQVLGRPRHKLVGSPLLNLVDKQDRKKLLTHLTLCRRRGDRMTTELRLNTGVAADLEFVELISSPASEFSPMGEQFKSVISDITARKRAELALRESEERFRTMADAAPVMIWIAGPDKQCTYFNKPWLEFTGRTLDQELGDGWTESVHPDDLKRFIAIFLESFDARKQFRMEYRVRQYDGEYRWILDHGLPNFSASNQFLGYIGSCVDITDRKRMESALHAAARLSRENPSPVIRLSNGRVLDFMNRAGQQVASRWRRHLGSDAPRNVARIASRALSKNERERHELSVGRRRFDVLFTPIRHGGCVNLYFNDVTERRRAEKALRNAHDDLERRVQQRTHELTRGVTVLRREVGARQKAERTLRESLARQRSIIEGVRDYAIYMLDVEGRVASWNAGAQHIQGYRAHEILGRHFSRFYPPEAVRNGKPQQMLEAARTTGRSEDEGWRVRKNGSRFWANAILNALYDKAGQPRGFLKITRDITTQKQALEALHSSEKKLTDFFDQAPLGFFWIGPRGQILRSNRAGLEIIGRNLSECVGVSVRQLHTDPTIATDIIQRLARKEVVENQRARLRRKDGSLRHVLIDASGMWENDRLIHTRWFVRDISRRVELEREILHVAERERQRIGRDLHDDLCQQLTGVEFLIYSLVGQLSRKSNVKASRAREISRMIRKAIVHTRELAHGLSPVELERYGLTGALQELAGRSRKMFQIKCRFHRRKFRSVPDPALGIHLYRIAQEAITNAVKHGKAKNVDLILAQKANRLTLTIRDDGFGMAPKTHEPKGMGLRAMRYRAGLINGTLDFESQPKRGTTVICSVSDAFLNNGSKAK